MNESRTKNTLLNIKYGTINQLINLALSFVSRTIFIKILGAEYLGINGLFSDLLSILSLIDLGLVTAMLYNYYKPLAENNYIQLASLAKFYKKIYNFIAFAIAIIGLSLLPILQYIVKLDNAVPYLKLYYLFYLANTVISYLYVYKTSIIIADQKNYMIIKYQMYTNIGRIMIQVIFLLIYKNYFLYLSIQLLATLINNFISSRKADKLYPFINNSNYEIEEKAKKSILKDMKSIAIYKVSSVIFGSTDNTFISMLVGTVWVGYYSNYNLVINALNSFINIIYSSTTPGIGNAIIKESPQRKYEIFKSIQSLSLIITTFTTVCLQTLFSDFIFVWLGPKYLLNNMILLSIIINFYVTGIVHPIWSFREATGLFRRTKYIMLIANIINILLSIIMGKLIGMSGILFATVISRLTTYFWYEPKLLFNQNFNESEKNYYIPIIKNVAFTILLSTVLMKAFENFTVISLYEFIVKALIVASITLIAVILAYRKTAGFQLILNRVKNVFEMKKKINRNYVD